MVPNNNFEVVCDDRSLLEKAIGIYNKTYRTDFVLSDFTEDEVNIATIEYSTASPSDIYSLGTLYGRMSAGNNQ